MLLLKVKHQDYALRSRVLYSFQVKFIIKIPFQYHVVHCLFLKTNDKVQVGVQ